MLESVPDKLRAQILLIPHHGSRTSSSPDFVAQVNPDIALVAAGYRNRFGHPKDDVLDRYRAIGSRIYRTDHDGALLIEIAGEGAISPGATVRYIDAIGTRRLKIQTCLKMRNRNDWRRAQSAYKSDGI